MNAGLVGGVLLIVVYSLVEGQVPGPCNGDPDLVCNITNPCMYAGEECVDGCCTDVTATTPSTTCSDPEFSCYDSNGTFQCYEGETCDVTGCCVDVTTAAP
uniref:WAP domain-containing protein n=1 Tax=Magallana gigas TaxID=29159 RepID=A0A8W8J516_MAGGI